MEPSSSSSSSEDVPSPPPTKESSPSPTASYPPPPPPSPTPESAPPPTSNSSPPPNRSTSADKPPSNAQASPESPPAPSLSPPPQSPQAIPARKPSPPSPVNSSPLPDEASTLPAVREPATPASQGLQQSPPSPTGFSPPSSPLPPNDPTVPLNPETPSSTLVSPPASGGSPSGVSSSSTPTDTKGLNITVIPVGDSNRASGNNAITFVAAAAVGSVLLIMVIAIFLFARKRRKRVEYIPPNNVSPEPGGVFYIQPPGYTGLSGPSNHSPGSQLSPVGDSFGSQTGNTHSGGTTDSGVIGSSKTLFSYEELMEITDGFCPQNIIGEGGFGCVYKGCVQDGKMVAVKHLKVGSGQGDREFKAEVEIISRIHHRHLVSLVGYCISNNQRLLIYDFVSNNTLEHHLHTNGLPVLDWPKRLKIAIGSSKGLAYLHEDCHPKIIHRDIKSANILLDDDFEAQVADFGLARLNDSARSHVSTRVMGTFGYMAPEYALSGKLTDKSDVFSFGVVLLELITGRKPVDTTRPLGDESLVEWAREILVQAIESGDLGELVDPRLENNYAKSEMLRMVETAAACVRHSALKRPSMVQVVRLLDSKNELSDLTNGVKFGKSTEYDSGQYSEDIRNFRRSAPGGGASSDFGEYASADESHGLPI